MHGTALRAENRMPELLGAENKMLHTGCYQWVADY